MIVEQQVACYTGYLFTNDPDYLTSHGSLEPMYDGRNQKPPPPPPDEEKKDPSMTEKTLQQVKDGSKAAYNSVTSLLNSGNQAERKRQQRYSGPFVQEIRRRLDSYLAITVRNVRDSIPKAIGYYLVRGVLDKLQFQLLNALNQKDKIAELLGEPPHIREERKSLTSLLNVLQKASAVLTRDPSLAAMAFEADLEDEQMLAESPAQPASAAAASNGITPQRNSQAAVMRQSGGGQVAGALGAAAAVAAGAPAAVAAAARTAAAPLFGAPSATARPGLFEDTPVQSAKKAPLAPNPLRG